MFTLAENYPGDAARGGDYLSGAARGEIVTSSGRRPERVIVTPHHEEFVGRICVGERTVRHMAHLLGLFDEDQVARIMHRANRLERERDELSNQLGDALAEIDALRSARGIKTVYVDEDGNRHASLEALQDSRRRAQGAVRRPPAPMEAKDNPEPVPPDKEKAST